MAAAVWCCCCSWCLIALSDSSPIGDAVSQSDSLIFPRGVSGLSSPTRSPSPRDLLQGRSGERGEIGRSPCSPWMHGMNASRTTNFGRVLISTAIDTIAGVASEEHGSMPDEVPEADSCKPPIPLSPRQLERSMQAQLISLSQHPRPPLIGHCRRTSAPRHV